jgi:hypothetical protein
LDHSSLAAKISIETQQTPSGWRCRVAVSDADSETTHDVTVNMAYRDKLVGPSGSVEDLLRRSFEFLLAREPKESILRSFDLSAIARYFPDYEAKIRSPLANC